MFARWRSGYASFMDSSELVLKNLYLQNWTRANDNTECGYAIYTIDQFYAAVKHAHTRSVQIITSTYRTRQGLMATQSVAMRFTQ